MLKLNWPTEAGACGRHLVRRGGEGLTCVPRNQGRAAGFPSVSNPFDTNSQTHSERRRTSSVSVFSFPLLAIAERDGLCARSSSVLLQRLALHHLGRLDGW